jgi:hypothetical protein
MIVHALGTMQRSIADHLHYVSETRQREAMRLRDQDLCSPTPVSKEKPTYVLLSVRLPYLHAAIQLTITPSPHPTFPCQAYYSSSIRFSLCKNERNAKAWIIERVQCVYDALFRPSQWDFNGEQWCVVAGSPDLNTANKIAAPRTLPLNGVRAPVSRE